MAWLFVARTQQRRLWAVRLLIAVLVVLGLYTVFIEPNRLVVHREELPLANWSGPPLRVVAISDLHIGALFMTREKTRAVVSLINEQKPDVVVLLGDYVVGSRNHTIAPASVETLGELRNLKSRLGTFAVLGNHDWWSDGHLLQERFPEMGIRVLENEAVKLDAFWLWGLADLWERRPDYAPPAIPDSDPVIALTHNPDVFPFIPERVPLTLAGHTHGGQVRFPLLGSMIVPSRFGQRYAMGRIHERGHDLFVTTGIGTSVLPIRFGVVPEILVLDVRPAK